MKFLFDFLPFFVFFLAYISYDFYTATAALIIASLAQLGLTWVVYRRVEKMLLISVLLVTVLGCITLFLHNEMFLKWKATIFAWISACVFLGSQFIGDKVLLQRMFSNLHLPHDIWRKWNLAWVIFFAVLGFLNLFIAYQFSTEVWVYFKMFGILGLMLVFLLVQAAYLAKYLPTDNIETNADQQK